MARADLRLSLILMFVRVWVDEGFVVVGELISLDMFLISGRKL